MDKIHWAADNIRILSASMVEKAKSGHPRCNGGADYINVLYSQFLNFDPRYDMGNQIASDPDICPMLFPMLSLIGTYSMEDLKTSVNV